MLTRKPALCSGSFVASPGVPRRRRDDNRQLSLRVTGDRLEGAVTVQTSFRLQPVQSGKMVSAQFGRGFAQCRLGFVEVDEVNLGSRDPGAEEVA